jgi:hypothetical protein
MSAIYEMTSSLVHGRWAHCGSDQSENISLLPVSRRRAELLRFDRLCLSTGVRLDYARWPEIPIRAQLDFRRVFFETESRSETRVGVGIMIPLRID